MADPKGLAPSAFPQTILMLRDFFLQLRDLLMTSLNLNCEVRGPTEVTESRDSRADSPNTASFIHELSFTAAPSPHGLVGKNFGEPGKCW